MSILDNAVVYDIETFPNCFTLSAEHLHTDWRATWEISVYRDDRQFLFQWFNHQVQTQTPMIGFNSIAFDYPVIHWLYLNQHASPREIYDKAMSIISGDRFAHTVWPSDRLMMQIDLFKLHHFDNRAKSTSLKALQINMRSQNVMESEIPFGIELTQEQINNSLIPYNIHDVKETKRFAHYSMKALRFREGLVEKFGLDVMNYNDTKIGSKMLERRLGDHVCYDRSSGRKIMRQTPRREITLKDIIFPYVRFENKEFQRVLEYMRSKVLTPDDLDDPDAVIKTKNVFENLSAHVGNIQFYFGTGGVHGSVAAQRVHASEQWLIRDIDVEGLYPNIAIVNQLAPQHLGDVFVGEYAKLPAERKLYPKGTVENASYKLASNGTYGNSNNKYSPFYDPQFTMTITINGQLMLCMLAEWLLAVPTLQIVQINTDGITYRIRADHEAEAAAVCKQWEAFTLLKLEDTNYSDMWIRDVNNYVAKDLKGKLKLKGVYWHPAAGNQDYATSISEASPPAWHKDLSNLVSVKAAVASMVYGLPPDVYIRTHSDPFDFMCRVKVGRGDRLLLGDSEIQRTSRYYVAVHGEPLIKISPPIDGAEIGTYKRRSGITDSDYKAIAATVPFGTWDERIHTKNRSKYEVRKTSIEAGWLVAECNNVASFRWDNLNYDYYVSEAKKLIVA